MLLGRWMSFERMTLRVGLSFAKYFRMRIGIPQLRQRLFELKMTFREVQMGRFAYGINRRPQPTSACGGLVLFSDIHEIINAQGLLIKEKTMKKLLLLVASALIPVFSLTLFAQSQGDRPQAAQNDLKVKVKDGKTLVRDKSKPVRKAIEDWYV